MRSADERWKKKNLPMIKVYLFGNATKSLCDPGIVGRVSVMLDWTGKIIWLKLTLLNIFGNSLKRLLMLKVLPSNLVSAISISFSVNFTASLINLLSSGLFSQASFAISAHLWERDFCVDCNKLKIICSQKQSITSRKHNFWAGKYCFPIMVS